MSDALQDSMFDFMHLYCIQRSGSATSLAGLYIFILQKWKKWGIMSKTKYFSILPMILHFLWFFMIFCSLSLQYASFYPHKLYIFIICRTCISIWAYSIIYDIKMANVTLGQNMDYFSAFFSDFSWFCIDYHFNMLQFFPTNYTYP